MDTDNQWITRGLGVAIAAFLLVGFQAQAGRKVTVQLVARPTQAAAVTGWSAHLDTAAQNAIAASGKPLVTGQTRATWIGINFSKHHIVPQTYLQVIAGLSINADAGTPELRTRLVTAIRGIAAGAAGGPPAAWNLGPVVWAPINLFEGPTGSYRSDDPKEGSENVKPKSFDNTRWTRLQAIKTALTGLGSINGEVFETNTDKLNQMQRGGKTGFQLLVEAVEGLAALAEAAPVPVQPFVETDWVDAQNKQINLSNLIGFRNSEVQVSLLDAKRNAYHLR
ncbi:MAG: hypothetical protein ACJ8AT_16845 [Hyalangium sp.]|uniref:hypothetical protein n=1 Tax=Hyalangium sp. TaxID=2028555 RepID=UPI00389AFCFA